jgi:hypothetical protein
MTDVMDIKELSSPVFPMLPFFALLDDQFGQSFHVGGFSDIFNFEEKRKIPVR